MSLSSFFSGIPSGQERVIGTYLYPYRLLGEPDWNDAYSATEVVKRVKIGTNEVLVTRNGGLFIQPPTIIKDLQDRLAFEEKAAKILNRLICEFALHGVVSEPATPIHISAGKLIDDHALITSGSGGREIYMERTVAPSIQLVQPQGLWRMHPLTSLDVLEAVAKQECSSLLFLVSENLPALVASAYSLFSQRQSSEALIDSWIVNEQIIDSLWTDYFKSITVSPQNEQKKRIERLSDRRTYSAAVRIEVLYTAGRLPDHLYQALNIARDHRNKLAHRAKINSIMAQECLTAMHQMLESFCGMSVEPPLTSMSVNW